MNARQWKTELSQGYRVMGSDPNITFTNWLHFYTVKIPTTSAIC